MDGVLANDGLVKRAFREQALWKYEKHMDKFGDEDARPVLGGCGRVAPMQELASALQ